MAKREAMGASPLKTDPEDADLRAPLVPAVTNAAKILRYLANAAEPVGVSQIARDLHINLSSSFNILRTLVTEELVQFQAAGKTYSLGFGVIELAKRAMAQDGFQSFARPMMQSLANKHGVTLTLWRRVSGERLMLFVIVESDATMRIHMSVGQRLPMYGGAMGRLMAGFSGLSKEELRKRFNSIRWQASLDFEQYLAQAKSAKSDGWAIDNGTYIKGALTVSAPMFDHAGAVSMVCSATMFSGQHSAQTVRLIAREVVQIADSVTKIVSAA